MLLGELQKNKEEWLLIANKKLDLPKLSEKDEAKLLNSIYDSILEAVTKAFQNV